MCKFLLNISYYHVHSLSNITVFCSDQSAWMFKLFWTLSITVCSHCITDQRLSWSDCMDCQTVLNLGCYGMLSLCKSTLFALFSCSVDQAFRNSWLLQYPLTVWEDRVWTDQTSWMYKLFWTLAVTYRLNSTCNTTEFAPIRLRIYKKAVLETLIVIVWPDNVTEQRLPWSDCVDF